ERAVSFDAIGVGAIIDQDLLAGGRIDGEKLEIRIAIAFVPEHAEGIKSCHGSDETKRRVGGASSTFELSKLEVGDIAGVGSGENRETVVAVDAESIRAGLQIQVSQYFSGHIV